MLKVLKDVDFYMYYKWEDQCLNDACQMADLFSTKHIAKETFSTDSPATVMAETYRHFQKTMN
jgi:hypothetical protein